MKIFRIIFLVALLVVLVRRSAAEPMDSPRLDEAVKSKLILVAKYQSCKPYRLPVTYFDGVTAQYVVTKVLKGIKPTAPKIEVGYAFHDGSACLAERGWKFSEAKMPRKGSSWILFLDPTSSSVYSTYRGDFGRIPATSAKFAEVRKLISK